MSGTSYAFQDRLYVPNNLTKWMNELINLLIYFQENWKQNIPHKYGYTYTTQQKLRILNILNFFVY